MESNADTKEEVNQEQRDKGFYLNDHDPVLQGSKNLNHIACLFTSIVMNDQPAKAVKFKIEIAEKSGYMVSSASTMSTASTASGASSQLVSSSAVAAILATVDLHPTARHQCQYHGNHSQSHLPAGFLTGHVSPEPVTTTTTAAARRASDGGSILSSAAAAVSTSLAAARNPFLQLHHGNSSSNNNNTSYCGGGHHSSQSSTGSSSGQVHPHIHHHQSHHLHHHHSNNISSSGGVATTATTSFPPLPHHPSTLPRRTAKVTLHQQQGANSTLRMIYEKLQVAWEQQLQELQLSSESEFSLIASPSPTMHKAQRGAAM